MSTFCKGPVLNYVRCKLWIGPFSVGLLALSLENKAQGREAGPLNNFMSGPPTDPASLLRFRTSARSEPTRPSSLLTAPTRAAASAPARRRTTVRTNRPVNDISRNFQNFLRRPWLGLAKILKLFILWTSHPLLKLTKIMFPLSTSCHHTLLMCSNDNFT